MNKYFTRGLLVFFTFFSFLTFSSFILNSVEARTLPAVPIRTITYHKVYFNPNFGSDAPYVIGSTTMEPQLIPAGKTVSLNTSPFEIPGHGFYWDSHEDGHPSYGDGDLFTMGNTDVTLHAQWYHENNTVAFYNSALDAEGGSGNMPLQIMEIGVPTKLSKNTFKKVGCEFLAWMTKEEDGEKLYADEDYYTMTERESFVGMHAVWSDVASTTINFFPNKGTGTMAPKKIKAGLSSRLTNAFTRTGYDFFGWATSASGPRIYENDEYYKAGESNAIVNLYALWSRKTYTVTFNPNWPINSATGIADPGTGVMVSQSAEVGTAIRLNPNTFAKNYYDFTGWSTSPTGPIVRKDGQPYSGRASITLYAQWKLSDYYVVTFDANGGMGSMPEFPMFENTDDDLPLNLGQITKVGYKFDGWTRNKDGSGTQYLDGASFRMIKRDVTLYAKWVASYTITFNPNEGTGYAYVQTLPTGISTTLVSNTFTREAYRFIGWATSTTGSVVYSDNASYLGSADANLYAVWAPTGSTLITFNANGGTGTMAPQLIPAGTTTARLTPNSFVGAQECGVVPNTGKTECWTAYGFTRWSLSPTATSGQTFYNNGQGFSPIPNKPNITLYANWYPYGASAPDNHNYASVSISWESFLRLLQALR